MLRHARCSVRHLSTALMASALLAPSLAVPFQHATLFYILDPAHAYPCACQAHDISGALGGPRLRQGQARDPQAPLAARARARTWIAPLSPQAPLAA